MLAHGIIDEKLQAAEKKDIVVFANVFGYTRDDYERTIQILNEGEGIAAYELNVSCPNTAQGGIHFGSDPRLLEEVWLGEALSRAAAHRQAFSYVQHSYDGRIAEDAGADAISLVNTFLAMAIDAETRRRVSPTSPLASSGPAIKPIALRMVYEASKAVKIPVIGMAGQHRRRCNRIYAGGRHRGADWNLELLGSLRHGNGRRRTDALVQRPQNTAAE